MVDPVGVDGVPEGAATLLGVVVSVPETDSARDSVGDIVPDSVPLGDKVADHRG